MVGRVIIRWSAERPPRDLKEKICGSAPGP
jgi:hypothetical protein